MTLEQILKKRGYNDQQLADMAPMLQNAQFRQALEAELGEMETTVAKVNKDLNEYDRWFTEEITPEHQRLIKDVADAKAEAAANRARFEEYQRRSMGRAAGKTQAEIDAEEAERVRVEAAKAASTVDTSKFVTNEVFQQTHAKVGDAIAVAANITSQHMQLFPGQFVDMEQLLSEARAAKKPVKEYWEQKYNVAARKTEISQKATQDREDTIRKEERQKVMVELGGSNPNLRPMLPSTNAFVQRKKTDAGKQPWERGENELASDRTLKAAKKAAERGEFPNA